MVLFLSTLLLEKGFYMLKISDAINVQVLQLPNDKNGRTAIVSANIIMTDGRVISDVCSESPRSPFENEDTLELAKNKIINSIKQKAEPYIKNHQNSSQRGSQDDKSQFQGGGDKPATDKQIFLIQKLAEENGKDAKQLCLAKFGKSLSTLMGREADLLIKSLKQ